MVYEVEEPDVKDPNYDEIAQVRGGTGEVCVCKGHELSPSPTYTTEPLHTPLSSPVHQCPHDPCPKLLLQRQQLLR